MRKFLPALFSGLLAVSFSQLAAAQTSSTQGTPDNRTSADTGIKSESGTNAGAGSAASSVAANASSVCAHSASVRPSGADSPGRASALALSRLTRPSKSNAITRTARTSIWSAC